MSGCRCDACRRANTNYEITRAKARKTGDWNGIVSSERARNHMKMLSRKGVGRRAVQAATDVADSVLCAIIAGRKRRIRARTERLILGVTLAHASDCALVSSHRTQKLIRELLEEGYSEQFLAIRLGYKTGRLQFGGHRITVRNADRVSRIHHQLTS